MPDFIRLVMAEILQNAHHLKPSISIPKLNHTAINKLEKLCARDGSQGVFRQDVEPLQLRWIISSFSFFYAFTQAVLANSIGPWLQEPKGKTPCAHAIDMVLRATMTDTSLIEITA